jgi:hypothetical protein
VSQPKSATEFPDDRPGLIDRLSAIGYSRGVPRPFAVDFTCGLPPKGRQGSAQEAVGLWRRFW